MSEQDGGAMTAADELGSSIVDGHGGNLEEASLVRPIMKPLVQICVSNILDVPTQKIILIKTLEERRFRDPPWSVGWQMDVWETTQTITPID
jgi:hypothetical protein